MAHATWNGTLIADSDDTVVVEGNHYFPLESVNEKYLRKSDHNTVCSWKGTASYYDIVVDDKVNENAAWYYPEPKSDVDNIKNYVAFWNGVTVKAG